jgi:hypothetical protein
LDLRETVDRGNPDKRKKEAFAVVPYADISAADEEEEEELLQV